MSQAASQSGVVSILEVAPAAISTNNLKSLPIYVINNVPEDGTSNLISVLSTDHTAVPMNIIMDQQTEDVGDKSYIMIPTLDGSMSNPIQFLDCKSLENNISIMRAIPPREIQKTPYKNKYSKKDIIEQNIPENVSIPKPNLNADLVAEPDVEEQHKNLTYDYTHIADSKVISRAVLSLPKALQRSRGQICARRLITSRTKFGPVQGIRKDISMDLVNKLTLEAITKKRPIFVVHNKHEGVDHIDVEDQDKSNWLSLVPLGDKDTANLWIYEHDRELFAVTLRSLPPRTSLAIGYCNKYVREHSLPDCLPTIDIVKALSNNNKWECEQCGQSLATPALLQRHVDIYHKERSPKARRKKYRCRECSQVFTRIFSLRRHMLMHCQKIVSQKKKESKSQMEDDDVKLPSDESFQNILDFTTSLMDPDKSLPNLDISSSSKSDENGSYSNAINDDNRLLDFGDISPVTICDKAKDSSPAMEDQILCRLCKKPVPEIHYKSHFRGCRNVNLQCCGRVFRNKLMYDEHVRTQHVSQPSTNNPQTESKENVESHMQQYPCEDCKLIFKRRGMLINHYWRAHPSRARAVKVPVIKTERRYLCSVCPKLYHAASKRDRHVKKHHPGQSLTPRSSYCVETGVRTANAALCTYCPRQYATRAKLLQHIRNKHINNITPD